MEHFDLRQVGGFLRVLRFPPSMKLIATDITEILLKLALITIKQTNKISSICLRFVKSCFIHFQVLLFLMVSYHVSLRSEFRFVMSVTISALKRCLVRLYLQLFVGGLMTYLRYLCELAHIGVQHILCWSCLVLFVVFFLVFSSSCVPCVASFSGLSICGCSFGIL
jgi:hypothetical protein